MGLCSSKYISSEDRGICERQDNKCFQQIFSELLHTNPIANLCRWHRIRKWNGFTKQSALTDICTLTVDKGSVEGYLSPSTMFFRKLAVIISYFSPAQEMQLWLRTNYRWEPERGSKSLNLYYRSFHKIWIQNLKAMTPFTLKNTPTIKILFRCTKKVSYSSKNSLNNPIMGRK